MSILKAEPSDSIYQSFEFFKYFQLRFFYQITFVEHLYVSGMARPKECSLYHPKLLSPSTREQSIQGVQSGLPAYPGGSGRLPGGGGV